MSNELTVIEVSETQAPAVFVSGGLEDFYQKIKQEVESEVPDLTTAKGRARVASLAAQVSRSKTAIEKPGRAYLKRLKEAVRPAEQEIKRFVDLCDSLRDEIRRPLTEWEDEQKRIESEKLAAEEAEKVRVQIESDHEIALLMNEKFDRDKEEKRKQEELARAEYERKLKEEAAERARQEEIARQQAERDRIEREKLEAQLREEAAKRKAEEAEKARISAEEKAKKDAELAEQHRIEAEKQAEINARLAAERAAEQERQRIIAEQAAIKAAEDKRAADLEHRREINVEAKAGLLFCGLSEEQAVAVIKAIAKGEVKHIKIMY